MDIPVEKFVDIIKAIIDRYGVKSLVSALGMYLTFSMVEIGLNATYACIAILILAAFFFVARHFEKSRQVAEEQTAAKRLGEAIKKYNRIVEEEKEYNKIVEEKDV